LAVLGAAMLAMLAPAIWNGFPLIFYDTGAFIDQALTGQFIPERLVFYGWFLRYTLAEWSLWAPVVAQALVTALTLWIFARAATPCVGAAAWLAIVVALAIGTGMPWYVGQVLPDFLSPLLLLSLYLLGFQRAALGPAARWFAAAVAVFAMAAHASHLALGIGLVAAIGLAQLAFARWRPACGDVRPSAAWPAAAAALALAAIVASNAVRTGEIFLSRSGPAHVFGRLVQDGIVQRLLDDTCPQSGYRLCEYRDRMPDSADDWLWQTSSPFHDLGEFEGTAEESARIIVDSLKRYPWLHVKKAYGATLQQILSFRTGDGIEDQPWPMHWAMKTYLPRQSDAYRAARQQHDAIDVGAINRLHVPLGILSLVAGVAAVGVALWRRRCGVRLMLPLFLLVALLGNAFVCGVLSNPHDRYQSRVLWTLPFALLLLAAERHRAPATIR